MTVNIQRGITFATLNVRGFSERKKQYHFQRLLNKEQPDFIALQETKLSSDELIQESLKCFLSTYEVCVSHAKAFSGGCFLFIKKSVQLYNITVHTDDDGRLIVCDFSMFNAEWRVVCVYAPNACTERSFFFRDIESHLECHR